MIGETRIVGDAVLTAEQKAHWNAFGFLILRQLFAPDEVKEFRQASIDVMNANGGENAFTAPPTWSTGAFVERHPVLTDWLADDRIYGIPETLLGPDFLLETNGGFIFWGDTRWHGGFSPEESIESYYDVAKVAMYFDTLTKDDGCLRVIPGTHRRPFGEQIRPQQNHEDRNAEPFGVSQEDVPCIALESEPGDVIVFTERVFHSAFGSKMGRMQFSSEYAANPTTNKQIEALLNQHDKSTFSDHPVQSFIDNPNPRIRRMVSRLVELGCVPIEV